jgi:hypothetical protein
MIVLVSLLVAPACANAQTLPAGARVAGLDVSGLSVDAAAARIETTFGARLRSTLQVRVGGRRLHLTDRGGGLALDAVETARRALAGGDVKPVVRARLNAFLDRLERAGTREPRDAELRYTVTKLKVARGMPGHVTPTGRYEIANKAIDPAWSAPDRPWAGAYRNEVVPGHGTDATGSLGKAASHGCIRMTVADVKALYQQVPVGALVMIK